MPCLFLYNREDSRKERKGLSEAEGTAVKAGRRKKERLSADGTPYTAWQRRTRVLCLVYAVWALVEIATGAGFLTIRAIGLFDPTELVPMLTFGSSTVVSGVLGLLVAFAGLWGAHNPHRITVFFWATLLAALLSSWEVASAWSMGMMDPAMVFSLAVTLVYATCAWQVRGQTGYFDNHPHPEDEDELPLKRDAKAIEAAVEEKTHELEAAKEEAEARLEDVKQQLETAKRQLDERK